MWRLIYLNFLFLFLMSCVSRHHLHQTEIGQQQNSGKHTTTSRDSAPSGPIPTFFRRIIPKYEAFSRYGNPDVYQVDGKTYEVMTTAHGYRARGLASWYGQKFHKRLTSSGERYDMYALTAAHRTLPLPTYIRVKNLSNGKIAIVKVNDRGPFHSKRILDLSYGAAVKLGLFPEGTGLIEIEAVNIKGVKPQHAKYFMQVGAFSQKRSALQQQANVRRFSSVHSEVERIHGKYVVNMGPFATKKMLDITKRNLIRHHFSTPVVMLR